MKRRSCDGNSDVEIDRPSIHSTVGGVEVLDLCCGKGGDLNKWFRSPIGVRRYVGVDVVSKSLMQLLEERLLPAFEKVKLKVTHLVEADLGSDMLTSSMLKTHMWGEGGGGGWVTMVPLTERDTFDLVSCQFAIHYMFRTRAAAHNLFRQVGLHLRGGGRFIATTIDCRVMAELVAEELCGPREDPTDTSGVAQGDAQGDAQGGGDKEPVWKRARRCEAGEPIVGPKNVVLRFKSELGHEALRVTFEDGMWQRLLDDGARHHHQRDHHRSIKTTVQHYEKRDEDNARASQIFHLRKLNNWVKSSVIASAIAAVETRAKGAEGGAGTGIDRWAEGGAGTERGAGRGRRSVKLTDSDDTQEEDGDGDSDDLYGIEYSFSLRDTAKEAAVDAPEYVVPLGAPLRALAQRHGLRLVRQQNFHDYFHEHMCDRGALPKAANVFNAEGVVPDLDWALARLYVVLEFEKVVDEEEEVVVQGEGEQMWGQVLENVARGLPACNDDEPPPPPEGSTPTGSSLTQLITTTRPSFWDGYEPQTPEGPPPMDDEDESMLKILQARARAIEIAGGEEQWELVDEDEMDRLLQRANEELGFG